MKGLIPENMGSAEFLKSPVGLTAKKVESGTDNSRMRLVFHR